MELTGDEIRRYSRHLSLPEVGLEGQRKICSASVLCIGAGGLGSPIAMYLAAAGIGKLGILDFARAGKITEAQSRRYHVLTPLFVAVMLLVPLADNLGIMWVAIESATLASVLLVTFYNQKTSFEAGWKYIIIGSIGISLALFGTIFTYYSAVNVLGADAHHGMNWSVLVGIADKFDPKALDAHFDAFIETLESNRIHKAEG